MVFSKFIIRFSHYENAGVRNAYHKKNYMKEIGQLLVQTLEGVRTRDGKSRVKKEKYRGKEQKTECENEMLIK